MSESALFKYNKVKLYMSIRKTCEQKYTALTNMYMYAT